MSDIWSFGLVMIELATGRYLFGNMRNNFVELFQKLKNTEKIVLFEDFDCSQNFRDFVNSTLTKDPSQRPNSIELLSHPWILENLNNIPDNFSLSDLLEK